MENCREDCRGSRLSDCRVANPRVVFVIVALEIPRQYSFQRLTNESFLSVKYSVHS